MPFNQLMHFRYSMLAVLNSKMELFVIYLLMTIIIFTTVTAEAQQICTGGFPPTVSDCTDCDFGDESNRAITRIIPEMSFTCAGTVSYWRAAGEFQGGGNAWPNAYAVLSVWRERSGSGIYDRVDGIRLGICGSGVQATLVMGMSNVYECTLPESERVSVQPGDIVGIELSGQNNARFRLHFDDNSGPTNYIFNGRSPWLWTVYLNANHGNEPAQPQVSLTMQSSTSNGAATAGAVICSIIAILIVSIVICLLIFVLRRWRNLKKNNYTPPAAAQRQSAAINPVYGGNITVQVPAVSRTGARSGGVNDRAPTDYQVVNGPRPNHRNHARVPLPTNKRENDYIQSPTDDMSGYAVPFQSPTENLSLSAQPLGELHYEIDMLYVPTQEQRDQTLPANGEIYAAIKRAQQSESGSAPELFEEDETYWEPASDACGLIRQLSSKKYREIVRPQIRIVGHLGSGQFGTVSKGIWQSPMGAMDIAVKQLQPGASEEDKVKFLQEAAINGQFKHPNIVKLMGVVTIGKPSMIVLELLTNGDLHKYLLNLRPCPGEILPSDTPQQLLKFCQQVASGMEHLARKSFVHRDLAARNILVSEDKICKISDFGMSRDIMNETYYISRGGQIPVKWTAPEAIKFKKYSTASDVWSFGCVVYEIWSLGQKPFQDHSNFEVIRMIDEGYRLPPPPGLPKELYKIMIQCWHPDRSSRPTFPQLVEMLSRADFELFVWEEDLRNSDPQVKLIGAPLEVAKDLYHELQRVYLKNLDCE